MQYFYINHGSVNNPLRIELINDGRYEFMKSALYNNAIQNADVTFSMRDEDGVLRVSNAPCNLILVDENSCEERYIIEYQWKKRDTKKPGKYIGTFEITFNGDLYEDGVAYPSGNLIVPIYEDLGIIIK